MDRPKYMHKDNCRKTHQLRPKCTRQTKKEASIVFHGAALLYNIHFATPLGKVLL